MLSKHPTGLHTLSIRIIMKYGSSMADPAGKGTSESFADVEELSAGCPIQLLDNVLDVAIAVNRSGSMLSTHHAEMQLRAPWLSLACEQAGQHSQPQRMARMTQTQACGSRAASLLRLSRRSRPTMQFVYLNLTWGSEQNKYQL